MTSFNLVSSFEPTGDQPQAIDTLSRYIQDGRRNNVLLGVTGSGKTFTIAHVIAQVNKPTLVLALRAQGELDSDHVDGKGDH